MHSAQWRLQPQHLHGRNRPTSCTYTHPSYNWVTWRLGAMLQKLPVQEWMLQWHVFRWCAQMHPTQWRCLHPLHLHGCMSKLAYFAIKSIIISRQSWIFCWMGK